MTAVSNGSTELRPRRPRPSSPAGAMPAGAATLRARAGLLAAAVAGTLWLVTGCDATGVEATFAAGGLAAAPFEVDTKGECLLEVGLPPGGGDPALRVEAGTEARCEVVPIVWPRGLGKFVREPFGRPRTYRFRVFVPDGHRPHARNEVVAQWHSSPEPFLESGLGRGPNLALRIAENRWYVTYSHDPALLSTPGSARSDLMWEAPLQTGRWTEFEFSVVWSHDDDGRVSMRVDGRQVADYRGPTAYNDLRGVYMKLGIYHPGLPRTIWLDDIAISDGDMS